MDWVSQPNKWFILDNYQVFQILRGWGSFEVYQNWQGNADRVNSTTHDWTCDNTTEVSAACLLSWGKENTLEGL